jgi:hypothetical protein
MRAHTPGYRRGIPTQIGVVKRGGFPRAWHMIGRGSWIRTNDLQYPKRKIVVSYFRTTIPVVSKILSIKVFWYYRHS